MPRNDYEVVMGLEVHAEYVKGGSDGSVSTRGWEVYPGSGAEDYFGQWLQGYHCRKSICSSMHPMPKQ